MSNFTLFGQCHLQESEEAINHNLHANKLRQAIDDFKAGKEAGENLAIIKQEREYFKPILFDSQNRPERNYLKNWLWAFKDADSIVKNADGDVKEADSSSAPSPDSKTSDTQNHSAFRFPGG